MALMSRVGVLGGTFDPVHQGHLAMAEECRHELRLDVVLFVPAGDPPHKRGRQIAPARHRVAMVELAIAGNSAFQLSTLDVDRPGPSFTVDTLAALGEHFGPAVQLWLLMGADSLADILTWRDPARLLELARVVAVNRPNAARPDPAALEGQLPGARQRIDLVAMPDLAISATDLRRRVAAGRPIRYQVPAAVEQYIVENRLYRMEGQQP